MSNLLPKLGGWKKEAVDPRDLLLNDHLSKVVLKESPSSGIVDLRRWCSPVESQRDLGSCVANAIVGGLEFLQIRNGLPFVDLSRLFVYYNARLITGDTDKDEGTYIRLGMSTLSSLGTCAESKWSYDTSKVFFRPSWGAYRAAYVNKIDGYYRIDGPNVSPSSLLDAIKHALESHHPVVFGCIVDRAFSGINSDGVVKMPAQTRIDPGGHAMLIVGYKDNGKTFIVRNSWGVEWGDNGYCYVPFDYLIASSANDFWVPTLF